MTSRTAMQHGLRSLAGLAAVCASLTLVAPASAQDADERIGEAIVTEGCSPCHAVGESGESPHEQAPAFRDLHERYPVENLAEALAEGIVTGHADMPEFVFQPEDIDAVIAYLKSLER